MITKLPSLYKKITKNHIQKRKIIEILNIPAHLERETTKEFLNAKNELENIEHLPCYICKSTKDLECHHIYERSMWNALDLKLIAHYLFNHFDFYGHCKRDFKTEDELLAFLTNLSENDRPDVLYNQLILCEKHHRAQSVGIHWMSAPSFMAWLARKEGFEVTLPIK